MRKNRNSMSIPIEISQVVETMTAVAREQKRRLRKREADLRGDCNRVPSRGPIQSNGRLCVRWHFYAAAKRKHELLTRQVSELRRFLRRISTPP